MSFIYRSFLSVIGLALATFGAADARAQAYPTADQIRFVSGYAVGTGADTIVRYFAEKVSKASGAVILVENKPGATGNIATEHVAKSRPNGYTVLVHAGSGLSGNKYLYPQAVDVVKDLQLVATINKQATMLVVPAKSPHQTIGDLTAAVRAKGDKATYGTSSTTGTITGEMYKRVGGLQAVLVPYKSAFEGLNDLYGGQLDYAMVDPLVGLAERRKGVLRILAVCSGDRMASSPDVPTMKESGLNMELMGWWAAAVPAATPKPIVNQLNAWFNQVLAMDDTKKFLSDGGADPFVSTPEAAQAMLAKEVVAWAEYVKLGQIQTGIR